MAAELQPEWASSLPPSWSYGVTRDGRLFFINEEAKSTTWLHPGSGEAALTGHRTTPDLPTGWEEGYTFEGARCFINHNEQKVTCKHPVSISVFCSNEKMERPLSTMSEASNYTGGSENTTNADSPAGRPSRSSKKIHNFGKRSNSIRRNPSAPVIKRNWLYKQDSTGMKLWKKRWFVLSDLCLFYYRDEKEEGILGSILLPSFHVSMLSVDDHVNRKYAFKAAHPNMRTYYFCTDTAKEMESWMKVMTDAALVQAEPVKRLDKLKVEECGPQESNHVENHRSQLTEPEIQKNERNREVDQEERKQRDAERYGFQKDGGERERPLTKINSVKLQPAQAAAVKNNITSAQVSTETDGSRRSPQVNGSGEQSPANGTGGPPQRTPTHEADRNLSRTSSMHQLEQWVRTQRGRGQDEDNRSIASYQTLPRNMPSHRVQYMPQYGETYCSIPRNSIAQRDSICSISPSLYEALGPSPVDKRRSMRDDTMWHLFEWQQRQAYARQPGLYNNMSSPKTMMNLSEHAVPMHSIPPSPSHGSLSMYGGYSPMRSYSMLGARSEVSSPIYRRDQSFERRQRPQYSKYVYPPDRRSMPVGIPVQTITSQSLQSKTVSHNPGRVTPLCSPPHQSKLSRMCELDKILRTQEEKLQQLYREKHTLETALLSASQEIEMGSDNPAAMQSVIQQRDLLESGLLSTCREISRVTAELERLWREYDKIEGEVTVTKNILLEQLEALGSPQMEPPSQQHVFFQKELWKIQDVLEALSQHKAQRHAVDGMNPYKHRAEVKRRPQGPDYRLYKSEPELTTVTEVDENNGEDRSEHPPETPGNKGTSYPVGIVPPRTKSPVPESSSIASYVTLRKNKKSDSRMVSLKSLNRPRSAVEQQLCPGESGRPRMSVEEQLERIRRHQQGALREKKKGLGIRASSQDSTPSRSQSFTKENHFRSSQMRRRDEVISCDIQELEASLRQQEVVREQETPAEEIARLKEASADDHINMDRENVLPSLALSPEDDTVEEVTLQEKEKLINISYELAAEASKRSKLVAGRRPHRGARPCCACCTDAAHYVTDWVDSGCALVFDHL
uniref:Pleckstrin homology domain containing A5 n=1 Tax=Takifugu rubripes TaxID=31033 RepID=A0A674NCD4_TAKRU